MRSKALVILSSVCLLAGAAILISSPKSAYSGTSAAAPQTGWFASLQFKDLTIAASLP